jgi:hypothetical protein
MKKFFIVAVFAVMAMSVNLYGQTPEADYILKLDFSADQSGAPYPQYATAYLVNTTDAVLAFASFGIDEPNPWMGGVKIYYYPDEYLPLKYDGFSEVIMDINAYGKTFTGQTFVLQPGERVRVFSSAFNLKVSEKYPESYLVGNVYVNRQEKRIIAFFQNQGETK